MSTTHLNNTSLSHTPGYGQAEFAARVVARLQKGATEVPHDIAERLRVARSQAVSLRKKAPVQSRRAAAASIQAVGSAASLTLGSGFDGENRSLWNWCASMLPIVALVVGLITVNAIQNDNRANEVAEVDAALLVDDLPPAAYVDPGFAHFLKASQNLAP